MSSISSPTNLLFSPIDDLSNVGKDGPSTIFIGTLVGLLAFIVVMVTIVGVKLYYRYFKPGRNELGRKITTTARVIQI
jgi:hypothetical protein